MLLCRLLIPFSYYIIVFLCQSPTVYLSFHPNPFSPPLLSPPYTIGGGLQGLLGQGG
jgi:hypothetical protein